MKRAGVAPVSAFLRTCFIGFSLVACMTAAADPASVTIAGGTQYAGGTPRPLVFPLTRSGDLGYDIALSYHTVDGTAIAGVDYTAASGTLVLPFGATGASLAATILPYHGGSTDLTFQLNLDSATGIGPAPSFAAQQTFTTGTYPYSAVAADINGDGKLDLIVANYNSGASPGVVSVLLNTTAPGAATPSFAAQQTFVTGDGPSSVAAADVDGDGKPDLIVANYTASTISVLLNTTPTGATTPSFATQTLAVGVNPIQLAAADFNGDGKPDVAAVSENDDTVRVLLNTGAPVPVFAAQQTFATGTTPNSIAVADINGDGKPDIVVTNANDNTVSVLLNTTAPGASTASFAARQNYAAETFPLSVAAVDINGDGKPDLMVANISVGVCCGTPGSVSVLVNATSPGATTASFAAQQTFTLANRPTWVTAADINGDGKLDLLVATSASQTVSVLTNLTAPGAAAPTFAGEQTVATGMTPISASTADLNGDGKPDLIVMNANDNTAGVLLNTTPAPTATLDFANAQTFSTYHAHSVATADFNGDGEPDIAVLNTEPDNSVSLLLNTSAPGATTPAFAAQQIFATGTKPRAIATRDLNGDGKPDLIAANSGDNTVSVLLNTTAPGSATTTFVLQTSSPFATGASPYSVAVGDLNGDGKPDLAVANSGDSTVSVLFNTGTSFSAQAAFATGGSPETVAIADINRDGKPDLLTGNYNDATVSVLLNTTATGAATPNFAGQVTFATKAATHPMAIVTADINGDGLPDIIVTNYSGTGNPDSVSVLLNTTAPGAATPSFATEQEFATGAYAFSVAVADLDGDGRADILVGNYLNSTISVLINTTAAGATTPSFAAQRTFYAAYPYSIALADFNGDGRPDIAVADAFTTTASVLLNTQYKATVTGNPASGTITHDMIFADGFE